MAVGAVPVTFVALPVDGVCRTPADFLGVFDGVLAVVQLAVVWVLLEQLVQWLGLLVQVSLETSQVRILV